jgi:GNAT superfamily N-acetyltransferase
LLARILKGIENGWCLNVAVVDGHIVGLLATFPERRILDQLFVTPDAQRQGIGSALLDEAKRQLATGFKRDELGAIARALDGIKMSITRRVETAADMARIR